MSSKEAIVICLDVTPYMQTKLDEDNNQTPLEIAIECVQWILQRRIFSESKDEIGLVLFGTKESKNPLFEPGQYQNVSIIRELGVPDWDFVKTVANDIPTRSVDADFLDALVVALDMLQRACQDSTKKFVQRSVVLFSELCSQFSEDQIDRIIDALKLNAVDFAAIGPTFNDEDLAKLDVNRKLTQEQIKGECCIQKIIDSVDGTCISLKQALPVLSYFSRRQAKPTAWKCNFEIGTDLKIPICMYVKTKENKIKQTWKFLNTQDETAEVKAVQRFHKKFANEEDEENVSERPTQNGSNGTNGDINAVNRLEKEELDKESTVKAFKYGTTLVPLDQIDIETFKYKNEGKSFKLLAFTDRRNVKRHYFMGDGAHIVYPDPADPYASLTFNAIFQAMLELKVYALVRYAYNVKANPRIGVLIPDVGSDGVENFIYMPLPFSEDCRFFPFASLNSDSLKPTEDQTKAMDKFIDAMNIENSFGSGTEGLNPIETVNPYVQYVFQCLQQRALYPGLPLPEPSPALLSTISPSEARLNFASSFVESLKNEFKLQKVVKAEKRAAADIFVTSNEDEVKAKMPKIDDDTLADQIKVKIGTVRPVEEFCALVDNDASVFEAACTRLSDIIQQFVFDAIGSHYDEKALECMTVFRERSIQVSRPGYFNRFLSTFKYQLSDKERLDFLDAIYEKKLGLIFDEECSDSQVNKTEAESFFTKDSTQVEPQAEQHNVHQENVEEHLLDELE